MSVTGINYLYSEYSKNPKRIETLLAKKVEISEKLDASRFSFQIRDNSSFDFFKRNDVLISKVDRTIAKYYEKAIDHLENLSDEKLSQIPDNWKFVTEYFPNLQPVTISYDNLPLNNMVLTSIQVKNPNGKLIELITDKKTLDTWADIIEIEKPPIIFEGLLDDSQKEKIISFLNTPSEQLEQKFKTENFTSFLITVLNPELKKTLLNNDISKEIEGLIFRFDGKEVLRVSSPEMMQKGKKGERKPEKPSDIYNLTLVFIQEFMISLDFSKIKLKEKTFEERYIEFVSKCYNLFLETTIYKQNFENGMDFELPKFLTREESNLNFKFVKDTVTQKNLLKSSANKELFKIMLASLRNHKKKPSGYFTKELVSHHNELVDKIADYVNGGISENVLFSFEEFKSVFLTEGENSDVFGNSLNEKIMTREDLDRITKDIESPAEFDSYSDSEKEEEKLNPILGTFKNMFSKSEKEEDKKIEEVCIMTGNFNIPHNGILSCIEDACVASKKKVFLIINDKMISNELTKEMLDKVLEKNKNISGYCFSKGKSFTEKLKSLPKNKKCIYYAGTEQACSDFKNQFPDLDTFELPQHLNTSVVINKLINDDHEGFKKLVPRVLHNFYHKLKNDSETY